MMVMIYVVNCTSDVLITLRWYIYIGHIWYIRAVETNNQQPAEASSDCFPFPFQADSLTSVAAQIRDGQLILRRGDERKDGVQLSQQTTTIVVITIIYIYVGSPYIYIYLFIYLTLHSFIFILYGFTIYISIYV